MKRLLSSLVLVGALVSGFSVANVSEAQTRREQVVRAVNQFQNTMFELADYMQRFCGCRGIVFKLRELANRSIPLEMAARFDSQARAVREMRILMYKISELRLELRSIHNLRVRTYVQRNVLIATNNIGRILLGPSWIVVYKRSTGIPEPVRSDVPVLSDSMSEQTVEYYLNEFERMSRAGGGMDSGELPEDEGGMDQPGDEGGWEGGFPDEGVDEGLGGGSDDWDR